jgi:hypothetical protein
MPGRDDGQATEHPWPIAAPGTPKRPGRSRRRSRRTPTWPSGSIDAIKENHGPLATSHLANDGNFDTDDSYRATEHDAWAVGRLYGLSEQRITRVGIDRAGGDLHTWTYKTRDS